MNGFTKFSRVLITVAAAAVIGASGLFAYQFFQSEKTVPEKDVAALCGWAGEDLAKQEFNRLRDNFVPFVISSQGDPVKSEDKRVVLWDAAKLVNGGKHIPTFRQEIGDCVSMGAANACQYLLTVQIALGGRNQEWHPIFPPYIYGISRVQIGGGRIGCGSDGSVGSWAADGVMKYGCIASDYEGVPAYSGRVAKDWGCKGPPEKFIGEGQKNLVQSAAQVESWEDVRDAIVNGYPVTIASNVGFRMSGTPKEGKLTNDPSGSWAHQMCIIGYDPAGQYNFYILNSWGPSAHGAPVDDAPPGGFWVTKAAVTRIVRQGDSFAFSDVQGFPAREWDLDLLKRGHSHDDGNHSRRPRANESVFALGL